jgi:hypothetical protein
VAHSYLHACGGPREFPREVVAGAGSVGQPTVESALESRDCPALRAIATMDLWPYDDHFARALGKRDFTAAEATRREWLEALKETKVRCSDVLAETSLDARIAALKAVVGLGDEGLVRLRSKLLDALEAGDADALVARARAVTEREKIVDPQGEAVHTARLEAVEAMIEQEIRGRPRPAPKGTEAENRTLRLTLGLFGLRGAQPPQTASKE